MCENIEGLITCPLCGNPQATVHRQKKGKRVRYIRCYATPGSNQMRCGTLQCLGPSGQEFIDRNIKPREAAPPTIASKPAPAAPAPTPEKPPIAPPTTKQAAIGEPPPPPPARKTGVLDSFLKFVNED